ncbi:MULTISPECIES: hypothetical protein [Methylomonas]|uniref:hypothetical protein n=1 Tax=Methylomonas TaxID=416 RepID=UPI0034A24E60
MESAYPSSAAPLAPPPTRVEAAGLAPGFDHFWINGYWDWVGTGYIWRPEYWQAPRAGFEWQPHRREPAGPRWQGRAGHWRQR